MAREDEYMSKKVVVDGWVVLLTHPNPEVAWEIGVELTKMIGEPIASMAGAGGNEAMAADALPKAVAALMSRIDPKSSLLLIKRILKCCEIQGHEDGHGKKMLIDENGFRTFFQGKLGLMMKIVGETVAFTHGDFFDSMKGGIKTMIQKAMGEDLAA